MRTERTEQGHGPAVVVLAAAFLLAPAVATAPSAEPQSRDRYPWTEMQEHLFDAGAGGTLVVRVDDADLDVTGTETNEAVVRVHLRSGDMDWARDVFDRMSFRARQDGDRIVVESDERPHEEWRRNRWLSVRVEVMIPVRFDVDLETNDGDVTIGSLEGDAALTSQDGDISIDTIRGSSIRLHSQDGDLRARNISGGSVELRTQDGDIDIDAVSGSVVIDTSDGDIRIAEAAVEDLRLDTSDGDIHVGLAGSTRMAAATNDGDISIAAPASLQADLELDGEDVYIDGGFTIEGRVRNGRAEGRVNGGGETISARAGDGEVRLVVVRESN